MRRRSNVGGAILQIGNDGESARDDFILEVHGAAAARRKDDAMAKVIDDGKHLMLWNGDSELDIWTDRYDVRVLVQDYSKLRFQPSRSGHLARVLSLPEDAALCDDGADFLSDRRSTKELYEERYGDMLRFGDETKLDPNHASSSAPGEARSNDCDDDIAEVKDISSEAEQESTAIVFGALKYSAHLEGNSGDDATYVIPEYLEVPSEMMVPLAEKQYNVILHTSKNVREHGAQLEILLKVKQAGHNPLFSFLEPDSDLAPFYRFVKELPESLFWDALLRRTIATDIADASASASGSAAGNSSSGVSSVRHVEDQGEAGAEKSASHGGIGVSIEKSKAAAAASAPNVLQLIGSMYGDDDQDEDQDEVEDDDCGADGAEDAVHAESIDGAVQPAIESDGSDDVDTKMARDVDESRAGNCVGSYDEVDDDASDDAHAEGICEEKEMLHDVKTEDLTGSLEEGEIEESAEEVSSSITEEGNRQVSLLAKEHTETGFEPTDHSTFVELVGNEKEVRGEEGREKTGREEGGMDGGYRRSSSSSSSSAGAKDVHENGSQVTHSSVDVQHTTEAAHGAAVSSRIDSEKATESQREEEIKEIQKIEQSSKERSRGKDIELKELHDGGKEEGEGDGKGKRSELADALAVAINLARKIAQNSLLLHNGTKEAATSDADKGCEVLHRPAAAERASSPSIVLAEAQATSAENGEISIADNEYPDIRSDRALSKVEKFPAVEKLNNIAIDEHRTVGVVAAVEVEAAIEKEALPEIEENGSVLDTTEEPMPAAPGTMPMHQKEEGMPVEPSNQSQPTPVEYENAPMRTRIDDEDDMLDDDVDQSTFWGKPFVKKLEKARAEEQARLQAIRQQRLKRAKAMKGHFLLKIQADASDKAIKADSNSSSRNAATEGHVGVGIDAGVEGLDSIMSINKELAKRSGLPSQRENRGARDSEDRADDFPSKRPRGHPDSSVGRSLSSGMGSRQGRDREREGDGGGRGSGSSSRSRSRSRSGTRSRSRSRRVLKDTREGTRRDHSRDHESSNRRHGEDSRRKRVSGEEAEGSTIRNRGRDRDSKAIPSTSRDGKGRTGAAAGEDRGRWALLPDDCRRSGAEKPTISTERGSQGRAEREGGRKRDDDSDGGKHRRCGRERDGNSREERDKRGDKNKDGRASKNREQRECKRESSAEKREQDKSERKHASRETNEVEHSSVRDSKGERSRRDGEREGKDRREGDAGGTGGYRERSGRRGKRRRSSSSSHHDDSWEQGGRFARGGSGDGRRVGQQSREGRGRRRSWSSSRHRASPSESPKRRQRRGSSRSTDEQRLCEHRGEHTRRPSKRRKRSKSISRGKKSSRRRDKEKSSSRSDRTVSSDEDERSASEEKGRSFFVRDVAAASFTGGAHDKEKEPTIVFAKQIDHFSSSAGVNGNGGGSFRDKVKEALMGLLQ